MGNAAQTRATRNYRARLTQRGFTRFEIMALETDRDLIRSLAKRLAEEGPEAEQVRSVVQTVITGEPPEARRHSLRAAPLAADRRRSRSVASARGRPPGRPMSVEL